MSEPFPGLNLSYYDLIGFVLVLILIEFGLWAKRGHAFAIAIWFPVMVLTTAASSGIIGLYLDAASLRSGSGNMAGLGFLIDLFFLCPWIIAFAGAIISHPLFRRQSLKGWIMGISISVIMMVGLFIRGEMTEATRFVILDPNGDPISNQSLSVLSGYYGDPHIASSVITGRDGTFTLWIPPGKSFFIDASGSPLFLNTRIWNQEDFPPSNRTILNTYCDWDTATATPRCGLYPVSLVIGQKSPVPLILKSHADLTAPHVRNLVRGGLMQARNGANSLNLTQLVSNPEALEQLDLISEVMAKQPAMRPALIQGLHWSGQFISNANNATNSSYYNNGGRSDPFRFLLGQWLDLKPGETEPTPTNVTSVFRQKVDALGLHLILILKPYFGTEDDASGVIREMGSEGRPAIKDFAQAFPTATGRCQEQMLQSLGALRPTVNDLNWLVESGNPHLVFAGYEAMLDTIKPEERDLAKERVDEALTKATDPREIMDGKRLSANLDPIRLQPDQLAAYNDRGVSYAKQGNYVKAIADLDWALVIDPSNALVYYNRGNTYVATGDDSKAFEDFTHCLKLDPKNANAFNGLAWIQATSPQANLQDGKKAVQNATKACELSAWQLPTAIDTLAAACAATGDFDGASKWENNYLETANLSASDAAGARNRLILYQAHKPFRDRK